MAKKNEGFDIESAKEATSFVDRTDQKWYNEAGTSKVAFCESVKSMLNGKAEFFEFTRRFTSARLFVTSSEREIEKNNYVLFELEDGTLVLVKRWNEIK
jgi:hypothetical protein